MKVNLNGNQNIPVSVLTTDTFDAATLDVSTVALAGASISQSSLEDIDGDGDLDLVMNFRLDETNLFEVYKNLLREDLEDGTLDSNHQQFEASLTGETNDGKKFIGLESLDLFMASGQLQELLDELS